MGSNSLNRGYVGIKEFTSTDGIPDSRNSYLNTVFGPIPVVPNYEIRYMIVGGGGGGGQGQSGFGAGGGGAGGYTAGTNLSVTQGIRYTITIGAGGAENTKGTTSGFGSITVEGGGKGGKSGVSTASDCDGGTGGSGGGGGKPITTNTFGLGAAGVIGQGNSGGNGFTGSNADPSLQGGGGGGAGGPGIEGTSTKAGDGGAGVLNDITGTGLTYAIGGGAGTYQRTRGAGDVEDGSGFGAVHVAIVSYDVAYSTAGRANRGNGGGAGTYTGIGSRYQGKAGGSGVVILRIPTLYYSGIYTGTPTITDIGSDKVLIYTSSGTYTA